MTLAVGGGVDPTGEAAEVEGRLDLEDEESESLDDNLEEPLEEWKEV
jgi:hypothetical protein